MRRGGTFPACALLNIVVVIVVAARAVLVFVPTQLRHRRRLGRCLGRGLRRGGHSSSKIFVDLDAYPPCGGTAAAYLQDGAIVDVVVTVTLPL